MPVTNFIASSDNLRATMDMLLSNHAAKIPGSGFYNALSLSRLKYDHATRSGSSLSVYLTGTLRSGGTCDDPRIVSQLSQTAKSESGAKQVTVYVNDKPVQELLSGKN